MDARSRNRGLDRDGLPCTGPDNDPVCAYRFEIVATLVCRIGDCDLYRTDDKI